MARGAAAGLWRVSPRSPSSRSCGSRGLRRISAGTVFSRRERPRSWRSGWTSSRAKNGKAVLQYRWVPYARISTQLKRAMIAAEDARFTEHGGFDWDGIGNAIEKNRKAGASSAGGSTITQQLAKNLFLSPARSYWRKAEEAVVTVLLEALLAEAAHLRALPQRDRMGQRRVRRGGGCAALFRHRRRRSCPPAQAARLAAMTPSPRVFERRPDSRLSRRPGRHDSGAHAGRSGSVTPLPA